ncbi:sigma 54-interacting transcriptional regulator [Halobacillus shinanisalinarum]|uniref:HTH-type transcriptional regulatory protein TyrR n=1 Tax=Halobacillus shinanisalinarum TaxID=2932258 RepID=A0ABY4GVZ0_9BACI|nr:sigma 54-interacting transcriptional regulator [Halobacillus shinanisalinarum]UOQ92335.1 sigma 54-interacting transcriptional regulator [Halobacillus shinanisalinarum]
MLSTDTWNEYQAILHSLKDDIIVTKLDGTITIASKAAGEIYGMEADHLVGRSVFDLEKDGVFTPLATPMVLRMKKRVTFIQTAADEKKLMVTALPVQGPDGEINRVVSYSHDITELKELKSYIADMEDEMKQVQNELDRVEQKRFHQEGIVSKSHKMQQIIQTAQQVADVDVNVLLLGESGVGKSSLAQFIHNRSSRKKGPFIEINAGAISEQLFEAELFGYVAGAFTGAKTGGSKGFAEMAQSGTLFIDEIGELSPQNQVKLLKLIHEKQFYRVGGRELITADFRLITATNRDLSESIAKNEFREDLYFRINVVPVNIPPLRDRPDDIPALIDHIMETVSDKYEKKKVLDGVVWQELLLNRWPGNVRELINVIERLVVTSTGEVITLDDLPHEYCNNTPVRFNKQLEETLPETLDRVEKQILLEAKQRHKSTVKIAEVLGISQPSAFRKLRKHGIK